MTWDRDLFIEQTPICAWCGEPITDKVHQQWNRMEYHLTCYSTMVHEETVGEEEP
jgi:hypothetical protein